MAKGEDPWATLLARPWLTVRYAALAEGTTATWRGRSIVLAHHLSATACRCALMHELVHEERRIGWPYASPATMEHEEAQVRRETALRLVPLDLLAELIVARDGIEPVTDRLVAAEFDVTVAVASLALRLLAQHHRDLLERELARDTDPRRAPEERAA